MKLIKINKQMARGGFLFPSGTVLELPDGVAKKYIDSGWGEEVKVAAVKKPGPSKKKTAKKKAAPKKK